MTGARVLVALAFAGMLAPLGGCADDGVGGVQLGLNDPAGILDESNYVSVYAIKLYAGAPSCVDVEEGFDVVGMAPRGATAAVATTSAALGQASIQIPNGDYLLVVEAYGENAMGDAITLGVGCAAVSVGGDDSITITLVPLM